MISTASLKMLSKISIPCVVCTYSYEVFVLCYAAQTILMYYQYMSTNYLQPFKCPLSLGAEISCQIRRTGKLNDGVTITR